MIRCLYEYFNPSDLRELMRIFFTLIILFLATQNLVLADETEYIQFVKKYQTAHILEPGKVEITLTAGAMNSTLDVFNFKSKIASSENIDINQFGEFGDWQKFNTEINIGLSKRIMVRFNFGYDLLEIGQSEAEIQSYGLEMKTKLIEEREVMPTISLSLKFDTHIANNIKGKIHSLSFDLDSDISITKNFDPPETLTVGGLNDKNFSIGLNFGKIITENLMLYSFQKYIHTKVNSEFSTTLNISQFQKLKNDFSYKANVYSSGFGFYYHLNNSWLLTSEYQFYYFSRDFNDNSFPGADQKTAHVFDVALHYFPTENLALSIGGMVDSSFLAGEMPLTFNKKSASKFDNPYGELYLSLTFGFDIKK